MSGQPATWHYGIVARWWAEFNREGPEIDFYRPFVEAGQPALDAICGTGRLLIPWLHAGLDVDGADISADMLAYCRERAEREGLDPPNLYAQAKHELDLPRRYRTIVLCGGFGIGGYREHDVEALRRLYAHLQPGGVLLLDKEVAWAAGEVGWRYWPKDKRAELPQPWCEQGERRTAADCSEIELRSRLVDVDPLAQCATVEMRAALWRDGELIAEEQHVLKTMVYLVHELELMLEQAGFVDVQLRAGYEDRPPRAEDDFVVFIARKRDGRSSA